MITAREIIGRVDRVRSTMEEKDIKAFLISSPKNVQYLTCRETGRILFTKDASILWTRGLYADLYSDLYGDPSYPFDVRVYEKDVIKKEIKASKARKLAVEDVGVTAYERLKKDIPINLTATDIVERQRAVKSSLEIEILRKSAVIAMRGMSKAYEVVREGAKEIDALAEIEYEIRRSGSDSPPFEDGMLLSSGKDSADIHAKACDKKIRKGSTVVVDLGGRACGYYSDMTRTLRVGEESSLAKDLLEYVDNLRAEAIDRLSVGMKAADIHSFVEGEIEKKGYKFYHSTGHGVGLNIHELPNLGRDSEDVLEENMVFTIEPGIYIPGKFGVRFEDEVLLNKGGVEILTRK